MPEGPTITLCRDKSVYIPHSTESIYLVLLTIALALARSLIPWMACGPRELAHITNNQDVQDSRSRTQLHIDSMVHCKAVHIIL